jgi:hypothetical protein
LPVRIAFQEADLALFEEAEAAQAMPPDIEPPADAERRPPGRPSVMHIIEAEMRRRANATPCELMERLGNECEVLAKWVRPTCASMQPPVQPPGRSTIARKLGPVYRELTKERTKYRPN